jgi:hypothetical protein
MNWWTYRIVFAESLPAAGLLERANLVLNDLLAAGYAAMEQDGSTIASDPVGTEQRFPSVAKAMAGLASGGGGGLSLVRDGAFMDFGFRTSPPSISVSSSGSLGPGDEAEAERLYSAFRSMCERAEPVFASSQDYDSVESLWSQWGLGGPGLLKVVEQEQADVQAGRLPDVLPWLSFVDKSHFGSVDDGLAALPAGAAEPLGAGVLIKLAGFPWENRFAVRTSSGYEVVDGEARRLTDGARCEPAARA